MEGAGPRRAGRGGAEPGELREGAGPDVGRASGGARGGSRGCWWVGPGLLPRKAGLTGLWQVMLWSTLSPHPEPQTLELSTHCWGLSCNACGNVSPDPHLPGGLSPRSGAATVRWPPFRSTLFISLDQLYTGQLTEAGRREQWLQGGLE